MTYYDEPRKRYIAPRADNKIYLFVCLNGDCFTSHCVRANDLGITQILAFHANSFPSMQAVAVLRVTPLEGHFMTQSFNAQNVTRQQFVELIKSTMSTVVSQIYIDVSNSGMMPVYLDVTEYCITPTLVKTGLFFGYVTNNHYFTLLKNLFYVGEFHAGKPGEFDKGGHAVSPAGVRLGEETERSELAE